MHTDGVYTPPATGPCWPPRRKPLRSSQTRPCAPAAPAPTCTAPSQTAKGGWVRRLRKLICTFRSHPGAHPCRLARATYVCFRRKTAADCRPARMARADAKLANARHSAWVGVGGNRGARARERFASTCVCVRPCVCVGANKLPVSHTHTSIHTSHDVYEAHDDVSPGGQVKSAQNTCGHESRQTVEVLNGRNHRGGALLLVPLGECTAQALVEFEPAQQMRLHPRHLQHKRPLS